MYHWSIQRLKDDIRERGMADDDVIAYFVSGTMASAVLAWLPSVLAGPWSSFLYGWDVLLAGVGTYYLYQSNRGRMGQLFLQRYFSLGWVVGWRWLVPTFLAGAALFTVLRLQPTIPEDQRLAVMTGYVGLAELIWYWRLAVHLRDLSRDD